MFYFIIVLTGVYIVSHKKCHFLMWTAFNNYLNVAFRDQMQKLR